MRGVLIVKGKEGDMRTEFSNKHFARAEAEFNRLIGLGYLGSRMDTPTEGEAIKKFDSEAREIIMSPAIVAG